VIENNRPPAGEDGDLRAALASLDPPARDKLRRVLIHDQADRDAIASQLVRYRDGRADDWADIIDMLTLHPKERGGMWSGCSARSRPPSDVRRTGQAGERRGTRPLFASPRDARPALEHSLGLTVRDEEVITLLEPESMGADRAPLDHALEPHRFERPWVHLQGGGERLATTRADQRQHGMVLSSHLLIVG